MTNVTVTQHPVGQGGMMSGLIERFDKQISWMYDCGSNQKIALKREINYIRINTVDYLFLSHLDSDHIYGVKELLSKLKVKEVVLPYLNEVDQLVALAHDVASETLSEEFRIFLNDIEGWFNERGVERITYILPGNDDQIGNDGPEIPFEPRGNDIILSAQWSNSGELISQKTTNSCHVTKQKTSSVLYVTDASGFFWVFSPYAHRPSDRVLNVFIDKVKDVFDVSKIDNELLLSILKDDKKLQKLRNCYDNIWTDHNLVSMALYAGPGTKKTALCNSIEYHRRLFRMEPWCCGAESYSGWLSTGDMHLERINRRKAFFSHYRKLLDWVNVFVLPHHGSKLNFDSSLLDAMPNCVQCIAATGPNSYGHPSKEVMREVLNQDKEFVRVSERPYTLLQWRHYF